MFKSQAGVADTLSKLEVSGFLYAQNEEAEQIRNYIECGMLGDLLPQDVHGTLIYDVKAVSSESKTSTSKGISSIPPHTDGVMLDIPPKWVALYGVTIDDSEKCQTYLAQVDQIRAGVKADTLRIIKFPDNSIQPFKYSYNQSVRGTLEIDDLHDDKVFNVDAAFSDAKKRASQDFLEVFANNSMSFCLRPAQILIFNNWKYVHSRDLVANYSRHLHRYWIAGE